MSHADLYGDTDYRKQEKPLLVELIEKANPGFSEKAPLDQIEFAYPQAVAPTAENPDDTAITVRAAQGSTAIVGRRSVTYRRIDLSKLFRGRTLVVTRWSATNALPYADLRALLLEQCGVNVASSTFAPVALVPDTPTVLTVTAGSLCYKGAITVVWEKGKRQLSQLLGDRVLAGRAWPEGLIDFQDGSKPQGEYIAYDVDFTDPMGPTFDTWGSGGILTDGGAADALVAVLKSKVPSIPWSNKLYYAEYGGIVGLRLWRYMLPNPAAPEANKGMYAKVLVLEKYAEDSWFHGRLLLHYN